jgi:hypothetical protein
VTFDDGVNSFGNGLCSIAVTYRAAATASALASPLTEQSGTIECDDAEACRIEQP